MFSLVLHATSISPFWFLALIIFGEEHSLQKSLLMSFLKPPVIFSSFNHSHPTYGYQNMQQ
jgi:hypothetical protein